MAVRSSIPIEKVVVPHVDDVEIVTVRMRFRARTMYVCCVYVPSNSPVSVYNRYNEALRQIIDFIDLDIGERLYVLGDFNMTNVRWTLCPVDEGMTCDNVTLALGGLLPHDIDSSAYADLLYYLMGSGLSQTNDVRNVNGRLLDLIFCSDPCEVSISLSASPLIGIDDHHPPIDIELDLGIDACARICR